jgi:hypothetical protein
MQWHYIILQGRLSYPMVVQEFEPEYYSDFEAPFNYLDEPAAEMRAAGEALIKSLEYVVATQSLETYLRRCEIGYGHERRFSSR